jgi:hypothetical protein
MLPSLFTLSHFAACISVAQSMDTSGFKLISLSNG